MFRCNRDGMLEYSEITGMNPAKENEFNLDNEQNYLEENITYFIKPGRDNTGDTLRLAGERAKARGVNKIVLASTRGDTARLAAEHFDGTGIKLIVVPHQYGFRETQQFPKELIPELEQQGHRVHFGTDLLLTDDFYSMSTPSIMSTILRTFCQGIKVCHEILLMATDSGCVDIGEKVIVIAGTGRGADTAVVAIASSSKKLYELHVTEIICKPLETRSWAAGTKPTPDQGSQKTQ